MILVRLRRAVATLVMLCALLATAPAFAHAQLLSSDPAANAVLAAAPDAVRLMFNEPVTALRVELIGPDAARTDLTAGTASGAMVVIALPVGLAAGTSIVSWRVVSTDGHPIAGTLIFSVGAPTGGVVAPVAGDGLVAMLLWAAKTLLFAGLFAGVGGAAFGVLVAPPRPAAGFAVTASGIGLVAAPLTLVLQSLDALGLPLMAIASAEGWSGAFATSYGATAVCATAAFALALLSLLLPRTRLTRTLGALAYLGGALALSLSGHASAADPQWLTRPAVFLHLAGILAWTGALVPLAILLRDGSPAASTALALFSRHIPYAVAALVISGLALSAVQLSWPGPQWLSAYAAILAVKLCLLVVLFGLAAWNRFRLTARVLAGDARAVRRLRLSIGLEVVIFLAIAALVAGWRFTPPPRALADVAAVTAAAPIELHAMGGDLMAMVTIAPGTPGPVTVGIALSAANGAPVAEPQSIDVAFSSSALGIAPFDAVATIRPDGGWQVTGVSLPLAGTWQMRLDVRVSRYSLVTLETAFTIPSAGSEGAVAAPRPPVIVARVGDIAIADAFSRATLPNAPVGGGYMTIINEGTIGDRLLSAGASVSRSVDLHRSELAGDIMRMTPALDGIAIPAGTTVSLAPSGTAHIMFTGLNAPLLEGESIEVTLTFERAGTVTVLLPIGGIAADAPPVAVQAEHHP
jgi:copper transport protein